MNLLSLSYHELAEQMGISIKSGHAKQSRAERFTLKRNGGAAVAAVQPVEFKRTKPDRETPQKPTGQTSTSQSEQRQIFESRIATLNGQVAELRAEISKAEKLAGAEQDRLVHERRTSAKGMAQQFNAKTSRSQHAQQDDSRRSWWRRVVDRVFS